jgi:iron complex transport system substrate-binding protein
MIAGRSIVGFTAFVLALVLSASLSPAGEKTTVTDLAGREVSLQLPVHSVVLAGWSGSGNPFYTLIALLGDDAPKMILGMDQGLKQNRQWIWQRFSARYPALNAIPDVGKPPEINVEKIIALNPDVVMLPVAAVQADDPVIATLGQAGIAVIMNDFHTETLESHVRSISLIGQVVGRPERAGQLIEFYTTQYTLVRDRLTQANLEKPRVYVEVGLDPGKYSNTYGRSMWGVLAEAAGGDNITANLVERYGPVSPETVLAANPQVILLTGANWPGKERALQLGYAADPGKAQEQLQPFLARAGWNNLDAVQGARVYGIHHGLSREIWDFYALQCMAKWFHPELFADLDPLATFKEFHETFLGFSYSGVWATEME